MQLHEDKFEFLSYKLPSKAIDKRLLSELPFFHEFEVYDTSNFSLYPSSFVRDLGVFLDVNLNWSKHYHVIHKKSKRISAWILSTFYTRERKTMLTLFKSLIRPIMEYCCQVWSPHLTKDIVYLEKIQRSFTCRISGLNDLNYWERLEVLQMLSLQRRREKLILIFVWKIKNNVFPNTVHFDFKLQKRSNKMKAVLRPLPRVTGKLLTTYENSFIINAAKIWNCLPAHLTHVLTLSCFTSELEKFLKTIPDKPPLPGYPYTNNNSLTQQCI